MKIKIMTPLLCSALLTQLVVLPDLLYSQSDFYRGKTITLLHGRAPGGSGDFRVRAVLPFLQKYIPGNPTFVHEYMDGGGGRKAANHIFAMSRTDGLVLGNVGGGVVANGYSANRVCSTISTSCPSSAHRTALLTMCWPLARRPG